MPIFLSDLGAALLPGSLRRCVVKALLFGLTIPIITVYHGFTLEPDINEVPRAGTRAVVGAMSVVFTLDALVALVAHG
jgi:ABC-type transporter Mla maintaining outer membrane lipid asymmetry permease subunit MlaE